MKSSVEFERLRPGVGNLELGIEAVLGEGDDQVEPEGGREERFDLLVGLEG